MVLRSERSKSPAAGQNAEAALLAAAVTHHQAGRLVEAEALYRRILDATPRHFDATHLLGLVALQEGDLERAQSLIAQAIAIKPKEAAAHNNLGTVHLRAGRRDEARQSFERAVKLKVGYADALLNLGTLNCQTQNWPAAVANLRGAVAARPKSLAARTLLGTALLEAGDCAGAVPVLESAVQEDPGQFDVWNNLGSAHARCGAYERALECYDRALALNPGFIEALGNRGVALAALGGVDNARDAFEQAVRADPASAVAHGNFGGFLREQGELDEAIAELTEAIDLEPQLLPARIGLIMALRDQGRVGEAMEQCELALTELSPSAKLLAVLATVQLERGRAKDVVATLRTALTYPDADANTHFGLADTLFALGAVDEAVQEFRRALEINPMHLQARWALAMATLRPVYLDVAQIDASRRRFAGAIAELDGWYDANRSRSGYLAVGSTQPFYLAYQATDNRDLREAHGRLCTRLMAAWPGRPAFSPARRTPGAAIRVGFASAHVREHSVWNAITKGWVDQLDQERFDLHLFHLGTGIDVETERIRDRVTLFVEGLPNLRSWTEAILASELDVLIYPEIGMDAMTIKLASQRLAPVQCTTWGYPETTGLSTIDFFLSAQYLEPEDAQRQYCEHLVTLPNLGVFCQPMAVDPVNVDREELGLPQGEPLLLCAGTPFKYSPRHDQVWVAIARGLRQGRLVFFHDEREPMDRALISRLRRAFDRARVDFDTRVCFIRQLDRPQFYGLMQDAALMLDTMGFSGFNTALQGLECALPVVGHEGTFMRGRLASGLLRRMELHELVATSDEAFVEIAVRLAHDEEARAVLRREIAARRAVLFDDFEAVRGLERFLEDAVCVRTRHPRTVKSDRPSGSCDAPSAGGGKDS